MLYVISPRHLSNMKIDLSCYHIVIRESRSSLSCDMFLCNERTVSDYSPSLVMRLRTDGKIAFVALFSTRRVRQQAKQVQYPRAQ